MTLNAKPGTSLDSLDYSYLIYMEYTVVKIPIFVIIILGTILHSYRSRLAILLYEAFDFFVSVY